MLRDTGFGGERVDVDPVLEYIGSTIAYEHEEAREFFFMNTGCELLCVRHDGKRKVVKKYLDARSFFEEDNDGKIEDTENDF